MRAPQMWLVLLKWISISLPKRLLLLLRSVLALPKASRMGLVCSTHRYTHVLGPEARVCRHKLHETMRFLGHY